jgi:hypothetical protein
MRNKAVTSHSTPNPSAFLCTLLNGIYPIEFG